MDGPLHPSIFIEGTHAQPHTPAYFFSRLPCRPLESYVEIIVLRTKIF